MRSHRNPFRSRTSEQESYQGLRRFLKTFGVGALDLLPDNAWDRPVVIQSAPGAGKTSLLRTFSAEALHEIATHPHELEELHERMTELGVIEDGSVKVLGIRLPLKRDYALIDDLRRDEEALAKIFFRLLDAKVVRVVIAALRSAAPDTPVESLRWEPSTAGADALEKLGGPEVSGLMAWSHEAHREMLAWLDSVLPPQGELDGHHGPYSVQALSGAAFTADGSDLQVRPLLMFDDAQDIGRYRRSRLLDALSDRDLELHRWVAERYQALAPHELIGDGEIDRAYAVVHIEAEARRLRPGGAKRYSRRTRGFERLLLDISDRRAQQTLQIAAEEERDFSELVDIEVDENHGRLRAAEEVLNQRLAELADGNARYDEWLGWATTRSGHKGAVERRVVEILITRDKGRKQDTLFAVPLSRDELRGRWDSDLVEAGALFLREEHGLPFYFGPERLTKLASENIDQHIVISGALFEEVLARITMNRPLAIDAFRQDRIVWLVSDQFWREIPPRLPNGREVQHFLLNVAELCRRETYRPTAPYPPGATATAISMRDRERLLDPAWRAEVAGAEDLFNALSSAIGHNLVRADLDYSVKGDRWMVLYLNRLLCVRFGLALGYGGLRERPVEELCSWMSSEPPAEEPLVAPPLQEQLPI
jgi:hypothetical protein